MQKLMQDARSEFSSYIINMDDYDALTRDEALNKYIEKVDELFDMNNINAIDLETLKAKIKYAIRYDYRPEFRQYERENERLDKLHDTREASHNGEQSARETNDNNEKQDIAKKVIKNVQEFVEEECDKSSKDMRGYLDLMLEIAKNMTKRELLNQGYYDIEDISSDLSHIPLKVVDDVCFEYDEQIKDIQEKTIENLEQKFSDFSQNQKEKVSNNTKNVLQYEKLYEEYITNGSKADLNLGKKELGIDICVLELPEEKENGERKKGVAVSKSILEQAVKEENSKLVREDEDYIRVEANNFYFLVKKQEHDRTYGIPKQENTQLKTKEAKKERSKDEYEPHM